MKILIVSVTAGRGHHEAAKNCAEEFASRGWECEVVDLLQQAGRLYYRTVDKGYAVSIKRFRKVYGLAFRHASHRRASERHTPVSLLLRRITARAMRRLLDKHRPDAVLCTHVIGAIAMDEMKRRGLHTPPAYGLVTDYEMHPFWEDVPTIERILIAHPDLIAETRRRGIADRQVAATGIPVAAKFYKPKPPLAAHPFTILLMGGSMGFGALEETARELAALEGTHVIAICGTNETARENLRGLRDRGVTNIETYGNVSNVDELMDRSHIIVTKPGGLSTTEAAIKGLPMVLTTPIPGQEESNARFFEGKAAAIRQVRGRTAARAAAELMGDTELYGRMSAAARRVANFDGGGVSASQRIAELIQGDVLK